MSDVKRLRTRVEGSQKTVHDPSRQVEIWVKSRWQPLADTEAFEPTKRVIKDSINQKYKVRTICKECRQPTKHPSTCRYSPGKSVAPSRFGQNNTLDHWRITQSNSSTQPLQANDVVELPSEVIKSAQVNTADHFQKVVSTTTTTTTTTASVIESTTSSSIEDDPDYGELSIDDILSSDKTALKQAALDAKSNEAEEEEVEEEDENEQVDSGEEDSSDDGDEIEVERDSQQCRLRLILKSLFSHYIAPVEPSVQNHKAQISPGSSSAGCYSIAIPPVSILYQIPALKQLALLPETAVLAGGVLINWDPVVTHPGLVDSAIKCLEPIPGSKNSRCERNLNRDEKIGFHIERGVVPNRIFHVALYRCRHCDARGQQSRLVSSLSSEFIGKLPLALRPDADFFRVGKRLISQSLLSQIVSLRGSGVSFEAITQSFKASNRASLLRADQKRGELLGALRSRLGGQALKLSEDSGNCQDFISQVSVTTRIVRRAYKIFIDQQEPHYQAEFRKNAENSEAIAFDHVFPNGNRITDSGTSATFSLFNAYGQPILVTAAVSKSLNSDGIQGVLRAVDDISASKNGGVSKISVVFTDNARSDEAAVKRAIPQATVILDLFHLLQEIFDTVKRTSIYHPLWCKVVCNLCYVFSKPDIAKLLAYLRQKKVPRAEHLVKDGRFLKKSPHVRRGLATSETFLAGLKKAFAHFACLDVFTQEILPLFKKLLWKCPLAFGLPSTFVQAIKIGETASGLPIYRHTRGTNMDENFNRIIQAIGLPQMSPATGHSIVIQLMAKRSRSLAIRVLGQPLLDIDDYVLRNHVLHLQRRLGPSSNFKVLEECNYIVQAELHDYLSDLKTPVDSVIKEISMAESLAYLGPQISVPVPFSHEHETLFLRLLIRAEFEKVVHSSFHIKLIVAEGALHTDLYRIVLESGINDVFVLELLTEFWNTRVVNAWEDGYSDIIVLNVKIPSRALRLKESTHFKMFFEQAYIKEMHLKLPKAISNLKEAKVGVDVIQNVLVPVLPSAPIPMHSTTPSETPSTGSVIVQTDATRSILPCPACGLRTHRTDSQKLCPFYVFKSSSQYQQVHGESRTAAARDAWLKTFGS